MRRESLSHTIAALAPTLIQLASFLVVEVSNKLNLDEILWYPSRLTAINLFTLLLSLAIISFYSFWQNTYYIASADFRRNEVPDEGEVTNSQERPARSLREQLESIEPPEKKTKEIMKYTLLTLTLSIVVFIALSISSINNSTPTNFWLALLQWTSYVTLLSSAALAIYINLEDRQRRQGFATKREQSYTRTLELLQEGGWINTKLVYTQLKSETNTRVSIIETGDKKLLVETSEDIKQLLDVREIPPQEQS